MGNNHSIQQIKLTDPEKIIEIKKCPSMGVIFLKAFFTSPFCSNSIKDNAIIQKHRIILKNFLPDKKQIKNYKVICSFHRDRPDIIPITYLQTIFIGLLGKYITSSFFPINPLGLIHIFQSFEQKRPVTLDEILDLACILDNIKKTENGIETQFTLKIISQGETVWKGVSVFFTRIRAKKEKSSKKKEDKILKPKETILVPAGTGRKYARVSGDYNPHHLYTVFAKIFGFKKAIVHGMWSLARVVASLDKHFGIQGYTYVEASFKLPIFMPATTSLGYECKNDISNKQAIINFELRDTKKGLPHLKGKLLSNK